MDRFTIKQCIRMIKTYYKNGDYAAPTYCDLKGDYGLYNRLPTQAVRKIVKKFEETGVVINIVRPVHNRFACSAENNAIVSENVAADPNMPISRRSQDLGLSYGIL